MKRDYTGIIKSLGAVFLGLIAGMILMLVLLAGL